MINKINDSIFNIYHDTNEDSSVLLDQSCPSLEYIIKNWPLEEGDLVVDENEIERLKNSAINEKSHMEIDVDSYTDDEMSCDEIEGLSTPVYSTPLFVLRNSSRSVSPYRSEFVNNSIAKHFEPSKENIDLQFVEILYDSIKNNKKDYKHADTCKLCLQTLLDTNNQRDNFIKHSRDKHLKEFIYCQMMRIHKKEFKIPSAILVGEHLGYIMKYIGDGDVSPPAKCYVPGCERKGKDRNIMSGHFRSGHNKTYKFCQLLLKHFEIKDINRNVDLLEKEVSDTQSTRRKYSYKSSNKKDNNNAHKSSEDYYTPYSSISEINLPVDLSLSNFNLFDI